MCVKYVVAIHVLRLRHKSGDGVIDELRRIKMLDYMPTAAARWTPAGPRYHQCREGGLAPDQPDARITATYAQITRLTGDEVSRYYADKHVVDENTGFIPSEMVTLDAVAVDRVMGSHKDEPIEFQASLLSNNVVTHRTFTAEEMKKSLRSKEFDAVRQFTYSANFVNSIVNGFCSIDRLPAMSPEDFYALRHWVLLGRETADAEVKDLLNEYWNRLVQSDADIGTSTPVELASDTTLKVDLSSVTQPASYIASLIRKEASVTEACQPKRAAIIRTAARALTFFDGELKEKSARIRDIVKENRMLKERLEKQAATEAQEGPECRKRRRVQHHEADTDETAARSSEQGMGSVPQGHNALAFIPLRHLANKADFDALSTAHINVFSAWLSYTVNYSFDDLSNVLHAVEASAKAIWIIVDSLARPDLQEAANSLVSERGDVLLENREDEQSCRQYLKALAGVLMSAAVIHSGSLFPEDI